MSETKTETSFTFLRRITPRMAQLCTQRHTHALCIMKIGHDVLHGTNLLDLDDQKKRHQDRKNQIGRFWLDKRLFTHDLGCPVVFRCIPRENLHARCQATLLQLLLDETDVQICPGATVTSLNSIIPDTRIWQCFRT